MPFSQLVLVVGLARCGGSGGGGGGGKGKGKGRGKGKGKGKGKATPFSSPSPWLYGALATRPVAQWLGKISLGVYLVHEPLIDWLAVVVTARARASPPTTSSSCGPAPAPGRGGGRGLVTPTAPSWCTPASFFPKRGGLWWSCPWPWPRGGCCTALWRSRRGAGCGGGGGAAAAEEEGDE